MSNIRITGDGPKITATGSGSTVLVAISTGQHDPGSFSGVHNDLTGRSTTGAHVGTAVSIDPTGFNGNLDGTITNAQLLAAAVDDLVAGGGGGGGAVDSVDGRTGVVTLSDLYDAAGAAQAVADTLGDAATKDVGTTAGTVAAGDDGRLSDARTPTSHASSHASAGSDPVTLAQSQVTNLTTDLAAKVPTTRTVAGHALTADVTITAADVGAPPIGDLNLVWPNSTDGVGVFVMGGGSSAVLVGTVAVALGVTLLQTCTVSAVKISVNSGGSAGAKARIGIYAAGSNGRPGSLVLDCGTVLIESGGTKTLTLASPQQLTAGLYFFATSLDTGTSATLYGYASSTSGGQGAAMNRGGMPDNLFRNGAYSFATTGGAMTSSPTWTLGLGSGAICANIGLTIASVP